MSARGCFCPDLVRPADLTDAEPAPVPAWQTRLSAGIARTRAWLAEDDGDAATAAMYQRVAARLDAQVSA